MGVGGRGYAGEVVIVSDVCPKAPKVQICPFVHDCILFSHSRIKISEIKKRFDITSLSLLSGEITLR